MYSISNKGHRNCADLIPTEVQEAMNKSEGIIPNKYLYMCLLDNYIKDIGPWHEPIKNAI